MNFSYNKRNTIHSKKKIEILSVTSFFFIIISKCYNKPNLKNLMRKTEHCALKLTIFIIEHKLSWATAHFVRCNGMKMQSKQVLHNGIKRNKQTYVT